MGRQRVNRTVSGKNEAHASGRSGNYSPSPGKSIRKKKNVVSHRALFITVPLTFHPEKMSFYCVIPLFPKFILKPSFSHSLWVWEAHASHPRLAARPQSTSDVQPPHQSILSHSCLEHRDVRCMFCFTHLF